jgi:hypothetical protein
MLGGGMSKFFEYVEEQYLPEIRQAIQQPLEITDA